MMEEDMMHGVMEEDMIGEDMMEENMMHGGGHDAWGRT